MTLTSVYVCILMAFEQLLRDSMNSSTVTFLSFFSTTFFLFCIPPCLTGLSPSQKGAMTNLAGLLSNSPWNTTDPDPCLWPGVGCSNNHVTNLSLSGLPLSGTGIFSHLCQFDTLELIDLSMNHLDSIPGRFLHNCGSVLRGLKSLNLSSNRMSGILPSFAGFTSLEALDISKNLFGGSIGSQLDGLSRVKYLNLASNRFSGLVPTMLGEGKQLEKLFLSSNSFEGPIPKELFKYTSIVLLDLSFNQLTGSLPEEIGNLVNLESLNINSNHLSGMLPLISLFGITTLSRFAANSNRFAGPLPKRVLSKNLTVLDLGTNQLSWSIPSDLLMLPKIKVVDVSHNLLQGPIPANLSGSLLKLRLSHNFLNGSIPTSIGRLSNLVYFEVDENRLRGRIPTELKYCRNLHLLNLGQNMLEGPIPKELGSLQSLEILKLDRNRLQGTIPSELSKLSKLYTLNLSVNLLTGKVPPKIFIPSLQFVNLNDNKLQGPIPSEVRNSQQLLELQLANNNLSGEIPITPSTLKIALNLSGNQFEGPLRWEVGASNVLEIIDISNNNLTGSVPIYLVFSSSLTLLNVCGTNLTFQQRPSSNSHIRLPCFNYIDPHYISPPSAVKSSKIQPLSDGTLVLMVVICAFTFDGVVAFVFLCLYGRAHKVQDQIPPPDEQELIERTADHQTLVVDDTNRANSTSRLEDLECVLDASRLMNNVRQ